MGAPALLSMAELMLLLLNILCFSWITLGTLPYLLILPALGLLLPV